MIPTLFFGIPGSSSMAVMMASLAYCGVAVGPNMLGANLGLSYALSATVLLANILAVPFFFAMIPWIVRLSAVRMDAIAPLAIVASITAAMVTRPSWITLVQILAAAALGVALKKANWARGPFVLGYIIERMAENATFQTVAIWGWSAFRRPIAVALLVLVIGWIILSLRKHPLLTLRTPRTATIWTGTALALFFALAIALSAHLSVAAGFAPIAISSVALLLCLITVIAAFRAPRAEEPHEDLRHVWSTGLLVLATPLIGLPVASVVYVGGVLARERYRTIHIVMILAALAAAQLALLSAILDLRIERSIIGALAWMLLNH
jgi:putative tricarboxylic transport membrane protein